MCSNKNNTLKISIFLILRILELFTSEFCKFIKEEAKFYLIILSLHVCKQTFHIFHMRTSLYPYDRRSVSIVSAIAILTSLLILILFFIYILLSSPTKVVRTRSQLENLSKEELIEELITVDDITSKISDLTIRFDDFLRRFEVVSSG